MEEIGIEVSVPDFHRGPFWPSLDCGGIQSVPYLRIQTRRSGLFNSYFRQQLLTLPDARLVALVKRPLLDSLSANEPGLRKNLQVFACRRLAHPQLLRDEHAAHAVLHQVSIQLPRKMFCWFLEPFQNAQAALVGDRAKR